MWISLSYMNLYCKMSWKFYQQFYRTKPKFRENVASSRFNYKERQIVLTVHNLLEVDFWQSWLKFYDKVDLLIRMIIIYNVTRRYAIRLKFGGKFLTSLTKLTSQARANICCTIKRSVLLHCHNSFHLTYKTYLVLQECSHQFLFLLILEVRSFKQHLFWY